MTLQEFPKGKEEYCPRCYFEDEVTILREDCPHRTTKQDKYHKIMEVMSDKTLSFGCVIKTNEHIGTILTHKELSSHGAPEMSDTRSIYIVEGDTRIHILSRGMRKPEIIGHPLHIGDVLDWIEKNLPKATWLTVEGVDLLSYWKDKRLPLSPTDEELIDYIYNLLP